MFGMYTHAKWYWLGPARATCRKMLKEDFDTGLRAAREDLKRLGPLGGVLHSDEWDRRGTGAGQGHISFYHCL